MYVCLYTHTHAFVRWAEEGIHCTAVMKWKKKSFTTLYHTSYICNGSLFLFTVVF